METQKDNPQGNASLAGAEFTWKYYAGFYNKDNLPAEATRTWVTNVIKERPLSSGASDRKATQPAQTVHRQNVEKVVSQETRQNYTKDRRTKVQQTQTVQKNQQTTEKTRNLVTKKGQKKK